MDIEELAEALIVELPEEDELDEGELLSPSAEVAQMSRSSRGRRRLGETRTPAAEARDDIARARRNTRDGAGRE